MTDEPLIVRVVCSGPLLGSRTVTPAWFETADEVNALWPVRSRRRGCGMTIDVEAIRAEYRETVAATAQGGSGEDFATLAAYLPGLCDALAAERERVKVLETENAEIRAANEELDEMFDLNPLRRASNEQIWAELDERCARYSYSPKIADLRRERARLYRDVSAERERVRVLHDLVRRVSECIDTLDESDICTYFGEFPYALDKDIKAALAATDDGRGA